MFPSLLTTLVAALSVSALKFTDPNSQSLVSIDNDFKVKWTLESEDTFKTFKIKYVTKDGAEVEGTLTPVNADAGQGITLSGSVFPPAKPYKDYMMVAVTNSSDGKPEQLATSELFRVWDTEELAKSSNFTGLTEDEIVENTPTSIKKKTDTTTSVTGLTNTAQPTDSAVLSKSSASTHTLSMIGVSLAVTLALGAML